MTKVKFRSLDQTLMPVSELDASKFLAIVDFNQQMIGWCGVGGGLPRNDNLLNLQNLFI